MVSAIDDDLLVSIIIPAYNDEDYIGRAIDSCLAQTYRNIEVVCIDDGSTDDTRDVMKKAAERDGRVKVVALDENGGTHNARRAGLAAATGQLVVFLDGDDEWHPLTAERTVSEFIRAPYDVLHFATQAVGDGQVSDKRVKQVEDWTCPVEGELYGRAILERTFIDHDYSFNLACKAYPLPLVRRAFDAIGEVWCDAGEDALEYFAVAFFAEIYRGIPDARYYTYHLGDGGSEHEGCTAEQFSRYLRLKSSVDAIGDFLEGQGARDVYADVFQAHWDDQTKMQVMNWFYDVRQDAKLECMKRLLELWPAERIIDCACAYGTPAMGYVCEALGPDGELTARQLWAWGRAEGERVTREEYEESPSYRLGRAISAVPRRLRDRLKGE